MHGAFSKINYFFGDQVFLLLVEASHIYEIAISDHAPVSLDIRDSLPACTLRLWCFPSHLASQDIFKAFIIQEWNKYSTSNLVHMDNPALFWEAGKEYVRGCILSYTISYKREKSKPVRTGKQSFEGGTTYLSILTDKTG